MSAITTLAVGGINSAVEPVHTPDDRAEAVPALLAERTRPTSYAPSRGRRLTRFGVPSKAFGAQGKAPSGPSIETPVVDEKDSRTPNQIKVDYERLLSDLHQKLATIRQRLADPELQVKGWYRPGEAKELADLRLRADELVRQIERYEHVLLHGNRPIP